MAEKGTNCKLWGQKGLKFVLYNGEERVRENGWSGRRGKIRGSKQKV
jgi:hypothetical protein